MITFRFVLPFLAFPHCFLAYSSSSPSRRSPSMFEVGRVSNRAQVPRIELENRALPQGTLHRTTQV